MTATLEIRPNVRAADDSDTCIQDDIAIPQSTLVDVLACGAADRGDDAAAIIAVGRLADMLPADVRTRIVGQLDIDDLLAIAPGAGAVVVDTAVGLDPGWIVEIPFSGLAGRAAGIRPRSSHALSIPETVGLASIIRGRPLQGTVVAIGGIDFGIGEAMSWPVASAIDAFVLAIADAVGRVRRLVTGQRNHLPDDDAALPNGPNRWAGRHVPGTSRTGTLGP
jgi:hydrogenase maturation protease